MDLITLRGNKNAGKSETINIVYQFMLLFGYNQVPGHFRELGNPKMRDCIDILERRSARIGIFSMGDYQTDPSKQINPMGQTVQELILYLQNNGCDKAICVCNNTLQHAIAFIQQYNHILIDKTITNTLQLQRIRNHEDADRIYRLI